MWTRIYRHRPKRLAGVDLGDGLAIFIDHGPKMRHVIRRTRVV